MPVNFVESEEIMKKQGYVAGKCPICGSTDLEYGSVEIESGVLYYPVKCEGCGAIGKEFYNVVFTDIEVEKYGEETMKNRYVLLDEITLETICKDDGSGKKLVFESEEEARTYAEKNLNSWQIVEVPYGG